MDKMSHGMSRGPHLARQEVDGSKHDVAGMYYLVAGSATGDDPRRGAHNTKVDVLARDLQQSNHQLTRSALTMSTGAIDTRGHHMSIQTVVRGSLP